jgi:hypothetical protein
VADEVSQENEAALEHPDDMDRLTLEVGGNLRGQRAVSLVEFFGADQDFDILKSVCDDVPLSCTANVWDCLCLGLPMSGTVHVY